MCVWGTKRRTRPRSTIGSNEEMIRLAPQCPGKASWRGLAHFRWGRLKLSRGEVASIPSDAASVKEALLPRP